jgi:hypothetical protein
LSKKSTLHKKIKNKQTKTKTKIYFTSMKGYVDDENEINFLDIVNKSI